MRHNTELSSAEWLNCVTVLFFGIKIPTTKHEIMQINVASNVAKFNWVCLKLLGYADAVSNAVKFSMNGISTLMIRQSGSNAFVRVLSETRTLGIVYNAVVAYKSIVYHTNLPNSINVGLFVQRLYNKNQRGFDNYASPCIWHFLFWLKVANGPFSAPPCPLFFSELVNHVAKSH